MVESVGRWSRVVARIGGVGGMVLPKSCMSALDSCFRKFVCLHEIRVIPVGHRGVYCCLMHLYLARGRSVYLSVMLKPTPLTHYADEKLFYN